MWANRLFRIGLVLLCLAVARLLMPLGDPADRLHPGFWFEVYNFFVLLWLPALLTIVAAGVARLVQR